MTRHETVSYASEDLILVDSEDRDVGTMAKADAHRGVGSLHRAFSIFLFDSRGRVLMQKRSDEKPLWPMYWSNSCCSHPRLGETLDIALQRRLYEELGVRCPLHFLFKFEYQAQYKDVGSENELCHVFVGRHDGPFDVNESEIAELRLFEPRELNAEIERTPDDFTPWFKMEWQQIEQNLATIEKSLNALQEATR